MGQGELFALTEEQVQSLLDCDDNGRLLDLVSNIEETWQCPHREFLGKEWNLVHCCLSDGTCNPKAGSYPLNHCILGGRHLLPPNDGYMAVLVTSSEVVDIDAALAKLDRAWFCERFKTLFSDEFRGEVNEMTLVYLCDLYDAIKAFHHKAAQDGLAVLFTTDETLDAIYQP